MDTSPLPGTRYARAWEKTYRPPIRQGYESHRYKAAAGRLLAGSDVHSEGKNEIVDGRGGF
jgi:hypothetical protein